MNFLLHHRFAGDELHAEGAVGAMLSDLWRMAHPRARPSHAKLDAWSPSQDQSSIKDRLMAGVRHHLEIDRWFHASQPFVEGERKLKRLFLETGSPKLILFAHPAWEMCLDGALIDREGSALADSVRTNVARTRSKWSEVAEESGALDRVGEERSSFETRMVRIADALENTALYADYASARGIAKRLAGMRSAFALPLPSGAELSAWEQALAESIVAAPESLVALETDRAKKLSASL